MDQTFALEQTKGLSHRRPRDAQRIDQNIQGWNLRPPRPDITLNITSKDRRYLQVERQRTSRVNLSDTGHGNDPTSLSAISRSLFF